MENLLDVLQDTLIDTLKILPFLYITYVLMEYIEHKMSDKNKKIVQKAGKLEPLFGGLLGMIPQCGFSAAATNFYVGRIISLGTLIAVYLSTSDEMLAIMLSEQVNPLIVLKIVLLKAVIGITVGFIIDSILRRIHKNKQAIEHESTSDICEHDHIDGKKSNIFVSALKHTASIISYIFVISLLLNVLFDYVGEESLGEFVLNRPVISNMLAGLIGLIPNCAASVAITELYIKGVINFGTMMSGLLVGAGVGLLVLLKLNAQNQKENARIVVILYTVGVLAGILVQATGLSNLLSL